MITVEHLTKRYGSFTAVRDVSFTCRPGRVTGFLGPNGAGKTTAMRVMCGLSMPTTGRALIGGHHYRDLPNPAQHVGVLLDASAQHGGRTGREVLALSAKVIGLPSSRVDEMLAMVSLTSGEAERRVKNYSLGMRQRLGLAHALLGQPQVLVLDEPANGLDPAGIRWMRDLLKSYAAGGGTVLLSSHLLHEVEQIAEDLILIGQGTIVAQGTKEQLLSGSAGASTAVMSQDNARLAALLQQANYRVEVLGDGLKIGAAPAQVGAVAAEHRIVLTDLREHSNGLEEMFLQLTATTQRDSGKPAGQPADHHMTEATA